VKKPAMNFDPVEKKLKFNATDLLHGSGSVKLPPFVLKPSNHNANHSMPNLKSSAPSSGGGHHLPSPKNDSGYDNAK
jgi:hypothetical protein